MPPDPRSVDAADALTVGDTVECGYIASRVDPRVRRLIPKGSTALVIGLDKNPDDDSIELTLWRFGATDAARQSEMLMMDGAEEFPASLGGGLIGDAWNPEWTDAQRAYASNYGSGVGGWLSEDDPQILTGDARPYNTSLMR